MIALSSDQYGTDAAGGGVMPRRLRREPAPDTGDTGMPVTTAAGPVATIPSPTPSASGPQLAPPVTRTAEPMSSTASPILSAAQSAVGPTPTPAPAPAASAPAPAPTPAPLSVPATAADTRPATPAAPPAIPPAPINFAPPGGAAGPAGGVAAPSPIPPPPVPPVPAATQQSSLVNTQALTGDEVPVAIQPAQSAGLSALLSKAQAAASNALDNPTVWDDPLAAQIKAEQKRGIDENFTGQQDALDAELASRGLDYSSIAGSRNVDLATRKANALSDVDTNIAQQRANALAAGRSAALSGANATAGQDASLEAQYRDEARGERNYTDTLRNKAQSDAINQTILSQQLGSANLNDILRLVQTGMGYGQNGANLLGAAGAGYGYAGSQYGSQADAGNAQLGALAQLAMQLFGGSGG